MIRFLSSRLPWVLCLLAIGIGCSRHQGQTKIVKKDGTAVVGTLVEARPDGVVVRTPSGETLTLPRSEIASIEAAPEVEAPRVAADHPVGGSPDAPGTAGKADAPGSGSAGASASGSAARHSPSGFGASGSLSGAAAIPPGPGVSTGRSARDVRGSTDDADPHSSAADARSGDRTGGPGAASRIQRPDAVIPAGAKLSVTLQSAVGSNTSHPEDHVQAALSRPVVVQGVEVLPAGSELRGIVLEATQPGRFKGRAHVVIRFDRVKTPAGTELAIRSDAIRREAASTKSRDGKKVGVAAGIGAAVGGLMGRSKRALGIGAAAGAGVGAAEVAMSHGAEVQLGPGTTLVVRVAQPLSVPLSR